jgi:hypothetical protein
MSLPPSAQDSIPGEVASPLAGAGIAPAADAKLRLAYGRIFGDRPARGTPRSAGRWRLSTSPHPRTRKRTPLGNSTSTAHGSR